MKLRAPFELLGGTVLILLGALFFAYLPINIYNVSTNLIFIVFGLLFVRKGIQDRKVPAVDPNKTKVSAKSGTQNSQKQKKNQGSKNSKKSGR